MEPNADLAVWCAGKLFAERLQEVLAVKRLAAAVLALTILDGTMYIR